MTKKKLREFGSDPMERLYYERKEGREDLTSHPVANKGA